MGTGRNVGVLSVTMPGDAVGASASVERRGALFVWRRFPHGESASSDGSAVERSNGGSSAFGRRHIDEREPARPTARVIERDIYLCDIAVGGKQIPQLAFRGGRSQVIYINLCIHNRSLVCGLFDPALCISMTFRDTSMGCVFGRAVQPPTRPGLSVAAIVSQRAR
jgi:hypothetical protein